MTTRQVLRLYLCLLLSLLLSRTSTTLSAHTSGTPLSNCSVHLLPQITERLQHRSDTLRQLVLAGHGQSTFPLDILSRRSLPSTVMECLVSGEMPFFQERQKVGLPVMRETGPSIYLPQPPPNLSDTATPISVSPSPTIYQFWPLSSVPSSQLPWTKEKSEGIHVFKRTQIASGKGRDGYTSNQLLRPHHATHRFIFGADDRGKVRGTTRRTYPYYNAVLLSTGCSGTLVSPRHVLTAAHCLHDGYNFKRRPRILRAAVPHAMGAKVYYGRAVKVARRWHKTSRLSNLHRAMYDYGVLELHSTVATRRRFTPFDYRSNPWKRPISFVGFPVDLYPAMVESTCTIDLRAGSLLLNRCDSASGTSGAAALLRIGTHRHFRIIGVVSGVIGKSFPTGHFNAITRLTLPKIWEICDMIGWRYERYSCTDYHVAMRPSKARRYLMASLSA